MNRSLTLKDKKQLVLNSDIELGEQEGNGKGRYFMSRFIEPGIAHYEELGDILITKETLNKFIQTMVGVPVIIDHEDVTDKNVDKLRVGSVSKVWFNEFDGYFYCEGILTDPEAIDLVKNQGWNVSCAYSFQSVPKDTHNGKKIDMEFIDGEFLHLAIVKNPRYEGANIVVNKNDDVEWITVKGNHIPVKKGQSKDDAVKEFLEGKQSGAKDKSNDSKGKNKEKDDYKREADIALTMMAQDYEKRGNKGTVDRANELKEKLKKGEKLTEKDKAHIKTALDTYKPREHTEEAKLRQKKMDELHEALKNIAHKNEKDNQSISYVPIDPVPYGEAHAQFWGIDETGKTQYTVEDKQKIYGVGLYKDYDGKEKLGFYMDYSDKPHWEVKKEPRNLLSYYGESNAMTPEQFDDVYQKVLKQVAKHKANNSIGDITMTVLNELTDFIKKVVTNEKEEEMKEVKNEDKRKLIDEVGGILKGKVDDEIIKTVMKKMEEASYEPSEDDKADNEDDKEKEAKNKCKNEDDEKDEKVTENEDEDKKEDKKEEADNEEEEEEDKEDKAENKKVKNSMKDIVMGGNGQAQEQKLYVSRKERLEEGNKY